MHRGTDASPLSEVMTDKAKPLSTDAIAKRIIADARQAVREANERLKLVNYPKRLSTRLRLREGVR
jgi:hypothetical protein